MRDALSKRREDLDLDLPSSSFTIIVFDVFSIGSTGLRFWRVALALDLVCRSRSRSSLFNIIYDRLLQPRRVFQRSVYDIVLLSLLLVGFLFFFGFLFYGLAVGLMT
jgi:hypothetical protein